MSMAKDKIRVLVVDDEQAIRRFLNAALTAHGYEVFEATTGEEALTAAVGWRPDLVVLDLGLPGIDGIEVTRRLREWSQLPILILSVREREEDKVEALDAGADDYLTKPFAFEELLARIRALLRRGKPEESLKLVLDDLVLDPVTHTVTRAGSDIPMTAKEYSLLEYFMRNPERVLTRTMISEHVWNIKFDTYTNVIDVYISYLRNKIDKGHDKKLLHTVRGVGYMIKG